MMKITMSGKYHNFEVLFVLLICLYPQSTDLFTYHFGISFISSLRTFWLFLDLNLTTFIAFLILSNRKDPKILFILRFDVKLFDYNLGKMFCQFTMLQYNIDLQQVYCSRRCIQIASPVVEQRKTSELRKLVNI